MRVEDRLDDRAIAGAAAQDAAERVLRFAFARPRVPTQQRDRGEQHAGRADAALRGAVEMKGGAKPSHDRVAVAETLDGFDGAPFDLPDAGQAGADGFAVDEHRAGAAVAGVAADLDASQSAGLAQRMAEPLERRSVDPPRLAVELERNPGCAIEHQTTPPASPRTQVSIARRTKRQRRVAPIGGGRPHIVDRRQRREVGRLDRLAEAGVRGGADQAAFGFCDPLGDRRTAAHGDARVADDSIDDVERRRHHYDRDHEIAARAEFQERRAQRRRRRRHDDGRQNFIGGQRGAAVARDELRQRQPARAAVRGEFDRRVEDQQRRHAVGGGRGVAEIARDSAAILDLHGADFARGRLQRVESGRQVRGDYVGPGRRGADADGLGVDAYPAQRMQIRNIDIVAKERPLARRGKDVGRAGHDAGAPG